MKKQLLTSTGNWGATAIRFTLGIVLFSHGAQSMLGWFGGLGLGIGLPALIGFVVVCIQFFGSLMLITGTLTRVAALGVFGIFIGMTTYHTEYGFHMNWSGTNAGDPYPHNRSYQNFRAGLQVKQLAGGIALNIDERGCDTTTLHNWGEFLRYESN